MMTKKDIMEIVSQNNSLSVQTIEELKKSDLIRVLDLFIKNFGDYNFIDHNAECIESLNRIIDKKIKDEKFKEYYNAIVLNFIFDSFYILFQREEYKNNVVSILEKNDIRSKIINLLYRNEYLTPQNIAKKLRTSPQNVCNNLSKIREYDLISSRNMAGNKKSVVYYLNFDCKKEIKNYYEKNYNRYSISMNRFSEKFIENIRFEVMGDILERRENVRKYE